MSTREKLIKARLGMLAPAEAGLPPGGHLTKPLLRDRGSLREDAAGAGNENPENNRPVSRLQLHPHQPAVEARRQRRFAGGGALRLAAARTGGALPAPLVAGAQNCRTRQRADRGSAAAPAAKRVASSSSLEASHPEHLLCQDTYFVGTIKGVGKIYKQTVIDANSSHVFTKLYLSKVPMTAVDVLNDRVLPFCTDNGREYCGRPVGHPFELYLAIQQIQHRRTDIGSPENKEFCERFHRTVKEELYAVAFRKAFYESLEQLSATWMTTSRSTTSSAPTRATAPKAARRFKLSQWVSHRCNERR